MDVIADILLVAGALGAAVYCAVLGARLKRFNNLQNGVGGAVAVLSAQVDDMTRTLVQTQKAATTSAVQLEDLTRRAEDVARRLELMLASMHDLPLDPPEAASRDGSEDGSQGADQPRSPDDSSPSDTQPELVFASHRGPQVEAAE